MDLVPKKRKPRRTEGVYEVDPDGDTYIILHNANAPFAVWDPKRNNWPDLMAPDKSEAAEEDSSSDTERELEPSSSPMKLDAQQDQQDQPEVRLRVSSRHLILASPYFNRMLKGPWKESSINSGSPYTVSASDWDVEALLILMNIIHGQVRKVPRSLSLEMIAKVAVIVDYYQCVEVVEIFAERWLMKLPVPSKRMYYRDLVLRLFVSWMFSEDEVFESLTGRALYSSRGPLNPLDLPIPQAILDTFEDTRQEYVGTLLRTLSTTVASLASGQGGCSHECSSMLLGGLVAHLYNVNLFPNMPAEPYEGISFEGVYTAIHRIREPQWCGSVMDRTRLADSGHYRKCFASKPHECTIRNLLEPPYRPFQTPEGLSFDSFVNATTS